MPTGATLLKRPAARIIRVPLFEQPPKSNNTLPTNILDNPITSFSNKRLSRLMLEKLAEKEGVSPMDYLLGKGKTNQTNEINKAIDDKFKKNVLKDSAKNEKLPIEDFNKKSKKSEALYRNRESGRLFERESLEKMKSINNNVVEQITVKTKSGTKTRLDGIGVDKNTGKIVIEEYKASSTAPLTKNQKITHPEVAESGATVVGKGKEPFIGGIKIPPTKIAIIRKNENQK